MSTKYAVWLNTKNGMFYSSSEKHAHRHPLELHDSRDAAKRAADYYNSIGRFLPRKRAEEEKKSQQDELFSLDKPITL